MDVGTLQQAQAFTNRRLSGLFADAGPGGTSDDTAAVQAAIDKNTQFVVLRQGVTYTVSADLLPHSGQTVWAYGSTILRAPGNATSPNLISVTPGVANTFIQDVHIKGGIWDGNKANVTGVVLQQYRNNNGIRFWWAKNCSVVDAVVQNTWGGGIVAGDSIVHGLRIDRCTARWNYDNGIWLRPGCLDVIVDDCTAYGQTFHGIDAIRCDKVSFLNCHSWGNGPTQTGEGCGFRIEGCRWSQIIDCVAWDNGGLAGIATTYTSEGISGWTWSGVYNNATAYSQGQVVQWPPNTAGSISGHLSYWYCLTTPPGAGYSPQRSSTYWTPCAYDAQGGGPRNNYDVRIVNCRSTSNWGTSTRGIWASGGSYQPYDSVWYQNGASWGIYVCKAAVSGSSTTPAADTTNWIGPFTGVGILIYDANVMQVINCAVEGNYDGIKIGGTNGGSADVRIRGCDLTSNSHDGVNIVNPVSGTTIEISESHFDGNTNNGIETADVTAFVDIHDSSFSATNFQARALYEGGTHSTISFRRNKVRGQATEPVHFASATSYVDGSNDMDTAVDHASGTGNFTAATTATVTFGTPFKVAPVAAGIQLTPTGAPAGTYYVSAVSTTGFTVTCSASGTWAFSWSARNLAP